MNIILMNHFPLHGSGSGTYTFNIAQTLAKMGHKVTVIFPENKKIDFEIPNVKLHPVYFRSENNADFLTDCLPFNFPCFTTHPGSTLLFSDLTEEQLGEYIAAFDNALYEEISQQNPDLIHTGHLWIHSFIASKYKIPLITTIHGTDLIGYQKWPNFRKYAEKSIQNIDKIICISKNNQQLFLELFKEFLVEEKTILIPNGYNKDVFYLDHIEKEKILTYLDIPSHFKDIVCFAGKLTDIKGVDILLQAAKLYGRCDLVTIIAGDGILRNQLLDLKSGLNLKNVYFIGNVDHCVLNQIYNISDISIVPSRSEAFGLVAIEALACGTPVIATRVGGLSEIVKPKYGKLIDVDDYQALARAVKDIFLQKNIYNRSEIAHEIRDIYSQEEQSKKLIKVYKEIVED